MWLLISQKLVTKTELDEHYTLDDVITLYSLWQMQRDIEAYHTDELARATKS